MRSNFFPQKSSKKFKLETLKTKILQFSVEDASTLVLLGHPPVFNTTGARYYTSGARIPKDYVWQSRDPSTHHSGRGWRPNQASGFCWRKIQLQEVLLRELTYPTKREVRKIIIFKSDFWWDMLVFGSVVQKYYLGVCHPRKPHGDIITSMVKKFPMPQSAPL